MQSKKTSAAQYDAAAIASIIDTVGGIAAQLAEVAQQTARLAETISQCETMTIEDQWVRTWGEAVNIKEAAQMTGVGYSRIRRYIEDGTIKTTPEGRVLVRQLCEWAHSKKEAYAPKSQGLRYMKLPPEKRFIP